MSGRVNLKRALDAVLRTRRVAVRDLTDVSRDLHSTYRQLPLQLDESTSDDFLTL